VCINVTDEEGYFFPGTVVNFRIIGGSGIYADAVGSVTLETRINNFSKLTFSIAK